jgi:drug/metabolite transporter (DMT)-like permease
VLAVLLVVIGVLLIAVPQLIGMDDRSGLTLGVLAVLAGAVLLVLRLREARDEDGPDDGAVV